MEVILHYPTSPEGLADLRKRVATVHAQAIATSVKQLNCSCEQKIKLLEAVQQMMACDIEQEIKQEADEVRAAGHL